MNILPLTPAARAAFLGIAALFVSSFFTGCATVTRGTTEQLTVTSEPTGATVRLSTGMTGVTPTTFTIPRKGTLIVSVWKDGYEQQDITVTATMSGAGTAGFVGNALIGGLIGGGIDIATGATLSHTPNPVRAVLLRKPEAVPASPPVPAAAAAAPTPVVATTSVPDTAPVPPVETPSAPADVPPSLPVTDSPATAPVSTPAPPPVAAQSSAPSETPPATTTAVPNPTS